MPARITVYTQEPIVSLTAEAIKKGISPADWWTLGEDVGLDVDEVNVFMDNLAWSDGTPLEFRADRERRPVQFRLLSDAEEVSAYLAELLENGDGSIPAAVREHLSQVSSIVDIELGWQQLKSMYEVIAFEAAYWLAETYKGLIRSAGDLWFDDDEHRWDPFNRE